tara:strand:+ start:1163 stop:1591 length:429 start_codon:yes stop_codon:yes gene_type:complete
MPIKSFRGKMEDNTIDVVNLATNTGSTGYKIKKFQLMPSNLNTNQEACVKIYKIEQTTATMEIDFNDNTLLAAGRYTESSAADTRAEDLHVIFDNEIINQNIYITHKNNDDVPINYYFELEQIKLDLSENTVATLKDIRNLS